MKAPARSLVVSRRQMPPAILPGFRENCRALQATAGKEAAWPMRFGVVRRMFCPHRLCANLIESRPTYSPLAVETTAAFQMTNPLPSSADGLVRASRTTPAAFFTGNCRSKRRTTFGETVKVGPPPVARRKGGKNDSDKLSLGRDCREMGALVGSADCHGEPTYSVGLLRPPEGPAAEWSGSPSPWGR